MKLGIISIYNAMGIILRWKQFNIMLKKLHFKKLLFLTFYNSQITKLARWVPMCKGFSHFSDYLPHFETTTLVSSNIRFKQGLITQLSAVHVALNPYICFWWLIWPIQNDAKKLKNYWNSGKWVLIWEYSARAFPWVPTWQSLDGFQKSLHPCALDKSSLGIGRVKQGPTQLSAVHAATLNGG